MEYCFTNLHNFDECLENHASIVVTIGVISGIVFFAIERHVDRKHRNKEFVNSCKTILEEFDDHYEMFDSQRKDYKKNLIADNDNLCFVDLIQNTDAYESIIHSGFFTLFRSKTQLTLANLYIRIKLRNEQVVFRRECRYKFFSQSSTRMDWPTSIKEIDERIFTWECQIKGLLDTAKTLVEGEKSLAETRLPRVLKVYFENRAKKKRKK